MTQNSVEGRDRLALSRASVAFEEEKITPFSLPAPPVHCESLSMTVQDCARNVHVPRRPRYPRQDMEGCRVDDFSGHATIQRTTYYYTPFTRHSSQAVEKASQTPLFWIMARMEYQVSGCKGTLHSLLRHGRWLWRSGAQALAPSHTSSLVRRSYPPPSLTPFCDLTAASTGLFIFPNKKPTSSTAQSGGPGQAELATLVSSRLA